MTALEIVGLVLALLIMLVGVIGCVLPGLPGTPLVLAAALLHKLIFGDASASWLVIVALALMTVLSLLLDYAASVYGAKRLGATWRGAVGAMVGALAGLFFLPVGIVVGPFLGATLLELAGRRHWKDASKAGAGATLGLLVGAVGKVVVCLLMILVFLVSALWPRAH